MSNNLPGFIIAGLYKSSLVITDDLPKQAISNDTQITNKKKKDNSNQTAPQKKWFFGDNKKNISILVKDNSAVYINDEWLTTLTKLLQACNLTIADVSIINAIQPVSYQKIKEELQPQQILLFDVTANELSLPITFPDYQLQKYDGCIFMSAPSITLSADKTTESIKAEKRKLWEKLKQVFNI